MAAQRWVTRDSTRENVVIWDSDEPPSFDADDGRYWPLVQTSSWISILPCVFRELHGFVPDPGQCLRVEFPEAKIIK